VQPGNLFVAIGGFHVDGARFVSEAILKGAVAAVVANDAPVDAVSGAAASGKLIRVPDARRALAALAAEWFGRAAGSVCTIGITGTDGKTSTSYLTSAVLEAAGLQTGLFSTVANKVGSQWEPNESRQTTPEALEVQALLRRMLDAGVTHAVLESTSHGLALHKLDHCEYDVAVFTNLSPDHLDFHESVERYRAAKGLLFEMLDFAKAKGVVKTAVLNADDPNTPYMASRTLARKLYFGIDSAADVMAVDLDERPSAAVLCLETGDEPPEELAAYVADRAGVAPGDLTLLFAPTASLAGGVQIAARIVETALHKLHELEFDVGRVVSGFGTCPLPPVARTDPEAIGRTNDAILYGGQVELTVDAPGDELEALVDRLPSSASEDHGQPFGKILKEADGDFYAIDPLLFSPAEVRLVSVESGQSFHAGGVRLDVLEQSFRG
jgi:hypothetical protein